MSQDFWSGPPSPCRRPAWTRPFVCPHFWVWVTVSVCGSVGLLLCLSLEHGVSLFIYLFICQSVCQSVLPWDPGSVHLSIPWTTGHVVSQILCLLVRPTLGSWVSLSVCS